MAERATIQQTVQIGVETTPGVAAPANKRLSALGVEASPQTDIATFKPQGTKFITIAALGKEWVEADLTGQLTYTESIYPLASVLGNMISTPSGAGYVHVFEPKSGVADLIKTFTVQVGSRGGGAYQFTNGIVTEFGITFSRDSIELSGSMLGRAITDGVNLDSNETFVLLAGVTPPTGGTYTVTFGAATSAGIPHNATPAGVKAALEAMATIGVGNVSVTADPANTGVGDLSVAGNKYSIQLVGALGQTPQTMTATFTALTPASSISMSNPTDGAPATLIELIPVLPSEVSVYLSDSPTGPWDNTKKMTRVIEADFNISDRYGPVYVLDAAQGTSFVTHVETEPTAEITLTLQNNSEATTMLNQMRDGSTKYMMIRSIGKVIGGALHYQWDMLSAIKVTEHGGFSDQDGVYAAEYTVSIVDDAVWGHAMQVTVTNNIATL